MFGSYKDHDKIKKRARQVVWEWGRKVMVLNRAGLTEKVTSVQRPEPRQHLEEVFQAVEHCPQHVDTLRWRVLCMRSSKRPVWLERSQ